MKHAYTLLGLVLILCHLLMGSCTQSHGPSSVFAEAEGLMNDRPDSALTLLRSIPDPGQLTGSARARYALLFSQALDKNYIDTDNDSLIRIAVDYYKDRGDAKSRFYAYYYLGRVHVNGGRLDQATLAYTNAEQQVASLGDDYAAGLLYVQLGSIYREYYDLPKALESYRQATLCYERAGKEQHKLWGMLSQSAVYDAMGEKQKCYDLLCDILSQAKLQGETKLARICLGDLVILCLKMEKQADALTFYKELEGNYSTEGFTPSYYASVGVLQAYEKNDSLAQLYLKKAWELSEGVNDSIFVHQKASEIHLIQEQYKQAYDELEQCVILQNEEMLKALQQPVLTLQKDFLEAELAHKQYRMKMERLVSVLSALVLGLVSVMAVSFLRKKLKKQERAYEQRLSDLQSEALEREQQLRAYTRELETKSAFSRKDIERLTLELAISKEHIEKSRLFREEARLHEQELQSTYRTLLNKLLKRSSKQTEDTLCALQKGYKDNQRRLKTIDAYVLNLQGSLYGSRKASKELEDMVNEYYDHAMERLRSAVKLPDEKHYQLVCMLLAGMSVNFIATLTGETPNAIYKRRDKVREIIRQSSLSEQDVYLLL